MIFVSLLRAPKKSRPYLLAIFRVQQQPTNLNDLCRVLCDIYTVLIASCSYMNDDVAVNLWLCPCGV